MVMGEAMQIRDRIGCRMKLHDLHVLMAVAQTGSMSQAAALLNTGQPAVSRAIAALEQALGVRLLDRDRRGVTPTEYGRAVLSGGTAVFDDLRQTVRNIASIANPEAGEIRIGSNIALAASFTSAVVDRLSRRYPRMKFHLITGFTEVLLKELQQRSLDVLIARKYGSVEEEQANFEFLFDDVCVVAAGAQSPWTRRRRITLADLVNEPWVLPPVGSGIISTALEAFRVAGLDYPRATVFTDSPQVRMNLVATGRYLTIFTDSTLRFPTKRSEIAVLPVDLPRARFPNGIVTLKHRTLSRAAQLFVDAARDVASPLANRK
jgi:DNA-binding transcriptional LysR family regulator